MPYLYLCICLAILPIWAAATPPTAPPKKDHLYIDLRQADIRVGRYEGNLFKQRRTARFEAAAVDVDSVAALLLPDTACRVLFYFHCWHGGIQPYHWHSLRKLDELEGVDRVVSIEWHHNLYTYGRAWERAFETGRRLGPIMGALLARAGHRHFALTHSMGSRVLEGMLAALPDTLATGFEAVCLTAADLHVNAFDEGMARLTALSDHTVVYVHRKDRVLALSKRLHRRGRLGLDGHQYTNGHTAPGRLEFVDISGKQGLPDISNHIYFKLHKAVFQDISWVIAGEAAHRAATLAWQSAHLAVME